MKTRYLLLTTNDEPNIGVIKTDVTQGMTGNELASNIKSKTANVLQDHFDMDANLIKINSIEVMSTIPIYARANVNMDGETILVEFNETYVY